MAVQSPAREDQQSPPSLNENGNPLRTCLSVTRLEERDVPSVLNETFDWNGVATVTETVIDDDPNHPGQYVWNFHVTNESFDEGGGITAFALPVENTGMVSAPGNSSGWASFVGTFPGDPTLVAWQGPPLALNQSADFSFTTAPTGLAVTDGFVANGALTASGLLAIPTAAPNPTITEDVFSSKDATDKKTTLRNAIDKINNGLTVKNQRVTEIRFVGLTEPIKLNNTLLVTQKMTINGENNNVTVTRDATKGNFRLFELANAQNPLFTVNIINLTLKGGGGATVTEGGAILSHENLVLTGCTIQDNTAQFLGGGISAESGTLDITNCNIFNNRADFGGGIFINAAVVSAPSITGGTIHDNRANLDGGGIFILGGVDAPIYVIGVSIYHNQATSRGGGIAVDNQENTSPYLVLGNGTVIWENFATDTDSKGGGVYLGAGTLVFDHANITGNGAGFGGGLYLVIGTSWTGDPFGYIGGNYPDDVDEGL